MVGYKQNDKLTSNQKLLAGCISGCMTRFITQPLDVVKLKTQLQKLHKSKDSEKRWFAVTRKILRDDGVTAFWRGHNLGQIHSILAVSTQFYVYEMSTSYVHGLAESQLKPIKLFMCGLIAGCTSATLVVPLEVIRVRQMIVKDQYKGLLRGAREVYSTGGVPAFYGGLWASLLQMGPAVGISFAVFNYVQEFVLSQIKSSRNCDESCKHATANVHNPQHLLVASTIAGSASGFVSKSLTYPFDLAKRRMQIASHKSKEAYTGTGSGAEEDLIKCKRLYECLNVAFKKEGFFGLYRGWKVTIFKAQLTSIVAFTTYELVCYAIREINE